MKNILKISVLFLLSLNIVFAVHLTRTGNSVVDNYSKLQWQDDKNVKILRISWDYAKIYCKKLILDGYVNWRLPSRSELLTLVDYSKANPAIKEKVFQNITSNYYWSHTSNATLLNYAWYIGFDTGIVGYNKKELREYVRCVRTIT